MNKFVRAYIECALWYSTDDFDTPLDRCFDQSHLAPETLAKMIADCEAFQRDNETDLAEGNLSWAGHDFWLTRNRHGAGFWDGDWSEAAGKRLTEAAHACGEVILYVGDDGKIHGA